MRLTKGRAYRRSDNLLDNRAGPVDKNPFMWGTRAGAKDDRVQSPTLMQRMRPDNPFSKMLGGMDMAAEQDYLNSILNPPGQSSTPEWFKRMAGN